MNIRSITVLLDPGWPLDEAALRQAGDFISAARQALEAAGYPVQTTRLASVPFPRLVSPWKDDQVLALAHGLTERAAMLGFDYISLGPALPEIPASYAVIPRVLAATQNVFLAGMLTDASGRISLPAIQNCAAVIQRAADISPDGFANLRFAALANTPPGGAFFPAAYHGGGAAAFALATEAAVLAVDAVQHAPSLEAARTGLVTALQDHATALSDVADGLSRSHNLRFGGIDFSLAPFPEEGRSLGTAFERLGVPAVGLHGSLAAAAFLADALDRARFTRAGFSGLFLPVLEDAVLARRAADGVLTVRDLLLYSAMCGAGLDTVPLAGDLTSKELEAVLLDVAALACRLDKPLTARLMPIPGKRAGDPTDFDFAYFANSRVLGLDSRPLGGLLAGDEAFDLVSRPERRRGAS
jgi:uncharacterized protein (UPF0210 family)